MSNSINAKESIVRGCAGRIVATIKREHDMTYGLAKESLERAATLLDNEPLLPEKDSRSI